MVNTKFKELLGEAFPIIEKCAPVVATAVGGNIAGTAIAALMLVGKYFNSPKPFRVTDIKDAILNHPESESILKNLAENFSGEMVDILKQHFPKEIEINTDVKF